jgi:hypothetical protein
MQRAPLHRRAKAVFCAVSLLALTTSPALAGEKQGSAMVHGYGVYLSAFNEFGHGDLSPWYEELGFAPVGTGVRYYERQGLIAGYITAVAIMLAGAAAASSPKKTESYRSGNYIITTTYYRSKEEQAAIMAASAAGAAGAASAKNQSFDLEIWTRDLGLLKGDAAGFKTNYLFGIPLDEQMMLEIGWGFGNIDAMAKEVANGKTRIIRASAGYLGMPFRFVYGGENWLATASWEWNWWKSTEKGSRKTHFKDDKTGAEVWVSDMQPQPLRLSLLMRLHRFFGEASVVTPNVTSLAFGARLAAGVTF